MRLRRITWPLAIAVAAALPSVALASPAAPAAPTDPVDPFQVVCAGSLSSTAGSEAYVWSATPGTDPTTLQRFHYASIGGCSTGPKTAIGAEAKTATEAVTATCATPYPLTATETITYEWSTGQKSTIAFDRVLSSDAVYRNGRAIKQESRGTVIDGAGKGRTAERLTYFTRIAAKTCGAKGRFQHHGDVASFRIK
ncbi:hypothetical protein [Streptomyces sp. NPDC088785]|uniref:hypothetical protein n=1 Tax=Streptomyces sp. NPDC088785 TaxID=3365897 RepID=UPI003827F139